MQSPEVDAYIAAAEPALRPRLEALRAALRAAAPAAVERMAYGMPTLHQGENIVHVAAFAQHIGLYPGPEAIEHFAPALAGLRSALGSGAPATLAAGLAYARALCAAERAEEALPVFQEALAHARAGRLRGAAPSARELTGAHAYAGALWRCAREHGVQALFTAPTAVRAVRRADPRGELFGGRGALQRIFARLYAAALSLRHTSDFAFEMRDFRLVLRLQLLHHAPQPVLGRLLRQPRLR